MLNETIHLATGAQDRAALVPQPSDPLKVAFQRIEELETALRNQGLFLDRIEAADTGWWDKDEMAKAQAAIWNVLERSS